MFTIEGAVGMEMLRNSKSSTSMNKFYYSMMDGNPDALVKDDNEGFARLLKEERSLFYGSVLSPMGMKDFVALETTDGIPSYIGWTFQKNSEFTEFFNYHIHQVYEIGLWSRIFHVR